MAFNRMPMDVFFTVLDDVLIHSTWKEGLQLRRVNHLFDREVQSAYFDRMSAPVQSGTRWWDAQSMTGQLLCRYIKGQMSTSRPRSTLAANMQGAVEILQGIEEFSWDAPTQGKATNPKLSTINLGGEDRYERIQGLVALTAAAFLNCPDLASAHRLTWYNTQVQPHGWATMTAVFMNDKAAVMALLARQTDEPKTFHLADPLRIAVKHGNSKMARLLLANGASVNMYSIYYNPEIGYRMLLQEACLEGHFEMIRLLLEPKHLMQTDNEEYEVAVRLMVEKYARDRSSLDMCREVLRTLILRAVKDVRLPLLHYVVDRSIVNRTAELVIMAIELGFKVNEKGHDPESPLVHAVNSNAMEIAKILIAHGARPMHKQDYDAVSEACRAGRVAMLDLLLTEAISLEEYGHERAGKRLLLCGRSWEFGDDVYLQLMECLFDHGLDPNAGGWGLKALDLAIETEQQAVTEYLLTKNIEPQPLEPQKPVVEQAA